MKISLSDIKTQTTHNNSVFKKPLIKVEDNMGELETVNYAWLARNMILETHAHMDSEEFFLFLEGDGEMMIDGKWFPIKPGDFVRIAKKALHSLKNDGENRLVYISFRTLVNPPGSDLV